MGGNTGGRSFSEQINVGGQIVTQPEFTYKRVSTASGTEKDISGKGCILRQVVVNTAPANAVTINDGATGVFVIPTTVSAGDRLMYGDVMLRNGITITHTASAGDLTFIFKSF